MRLIVLTLFLLSASLSWSSEISLGGVSLEIPNPTGFSAVTQKMTLLYEYLK